MSWNFEDDFPWILDGFRLNFGIGPIVGLKNQKNPNNASNDPHNHLIEFSPLLKVQYSCVLVVYTVDASCKDITKVILQKLTTTL